MLICQAVWGTSDKTVVLQEGEEQFTLAHNSPTQNGSEISVAYEMTPSLNGGTVEEEMLEDTVTVHVSEE
ncbi:hypothetical protein [Salibacterium sp. K-3]